MKLGAIGWKERCSPALTESTARAPRASSSSSATRREGWVGARPRSASPAVSRPAAIASAS